MLNMGVVFTLCIYVLPLITYNTDVSSGKKVGMIIVPPNNIQDTKIMACLREIIRIFATLFTIQ